MSGFTKAKRGASNGTSLQGYIQISYAELIAVLGLPHTNGDGFKVDAEWVIELASGRVATIYNYKDGKNYNRGNGLPVEDITDWHVGGTSPEVVLEVRALF
jgi:hypothetical protein